MKLQYMGDCRDFYKYDLLLALGRALQPPVGLTVVPMLTLGGSPREGNLRSYRARHRDPGLHALVQSLVQGNVHELQRVADYFNAHGRYFRLAITLAKRKEDAIALLRARLSALLLISNDPRCTALELLREYIEQMSVEQGFRFIKEPRHIAPVFLKRPDRIEAFAYVQPIALLVYTLIQKKIRDALAPAKRPLQVSWRGEMRAPTAQIVLNMMERIQTITARIGPKRYKVYTMLSDEQRYILELLGLDPLIFMSPAPP